MESGSLLEHINRAKHLIDRALSRTAQSSSKMEARSTTKVATIERSELLQLKSELAATQAVAASDLNTTANVQTLHARVNRIKRMVSDLFEPEQAQNADGTSTDGSGGSGTVNAASHTIQINHSLLENLNVQVNAIDRLVGT